MPTSTLIITEKPSVAQAVAKSIGVAGRRDGYLEGNGYLVSWCVGHLVELSAADSYDPIPDGRVKISRSCRNPGAFQYPRPQKNSLRS